MWTATMFSKFQNKNQSKQGKPMGCVKTRTAICLLCKSLSIISISGKSKLESEK